MDQVVDPITLAAIAALVIGAVIFVQAVTRLFSWWIDRLPTIDAPGAVEKPVTADRYFPCLRCGTAPDPAFVPHCRCGCGLARIVAAVPTPEAEKTWPGDGTKGAA
jgi:hypothetical protein